MIDQGISGSVITMSTEAIAIIALICALVQGVGSLIDVADIAYKHLATLFKKRPFYLRQSPIGFRVISCLG